MKAENVRNVSSVVTGDDRHPMVHQLECHPKYEVPSTTSMCIFLHSLNNIIIIIIIIITINYTVIIKAHPSMTYHIHL
jgi:hypothetical protein